MKLFLKKNQNYLYCEKRSITKIAKMTNIMYAKTKNMHEDILACNNSPTCIFYLLYNYPIIYFLYLAQVITDFVVYSIRLFENVLSNRRKRSKSNIFFFNMQKDECWVAWFQ